MNEVTERERIAALILDSPETEFYRQENATPWKTALRIADAILAGFRAPAADDETEWAVSTVTEDDGVRDIYYAVAPSEHVARDRLVRERASYPWPDEIQLATRTVSPWVPVESEEGAEK